MASSVTPQRRRRSIEDDQDQELYSASPKRTRLDDEDEDEEQAEDGSQSPNRPLLPDSFRRSPKGKGRARVAGVHQPGSIVRVTLTDFVTYTKAEFNPGPNLNMIIGPNGTGKSTLVCALCLGLGWAPNHLGRAKQAHEFVKHGAKRAMIEIELAADPDRHVENPVIRTKITRDGNKTEFSIDGKKASKQEVLRLMRSFSIQVDNLCQFLPQDRVVEFAALSPVDLLAQTQRAAAPPQMVEWHDELKRMRKEQKHEQHEQQQITEDLKNKMDRQTSQESIVTQLRERSELQERKDALEKLRPFPEFTAARIEWQKAKKRKKNAAKELELLNAQVQPNLQAEEEKEAYLAQVRKVATSRENLVKRTDKNASDKLDLLKKKQDEIDACETEINAEKDSKRKASAKMPEHLRDKTKIERAMENPPPEADFARYNEQIREKKREMNDIIDRQGEIRREVGSLTQRIQQQEQIVESVQEEQDSLQTQVGQQASKLRKVSQHAARAWEWIQRNRDRFQGDVYGPPIVECSVAGPRNAAAVEQAIGNSELVAFTVTSQADFHTLSHELYSVQKLSDVNIRQSGLPLAHFRAPVTNDQLRGYGLESWIVDLIDGPEPVLAMLCDNRNISSTAFTTRELTNAQLETLKAQNSPISSWVTPSETYTVTRRREYGAQAFSVRSQSIRPARFFTDAPAANILEDAELAQRRTDANRQIEQMQRERDELKQKFNELKERGKELTDENKTIQEEKDRIQKQHAWFAALPTRLEGIQAKIDEAQRVFSDVKDRIRLIEIKGDKLTLEKGQLAIDYANAVNAVKDFSVQYIEAQIIQIEAESDLKQLKDRTEHERRLLAERTAEVEHLTKQVEILLEQGKVFQAKCKSVSDQWSDYEHGIYEDEVKNWKTDQLETEIHSVQARLDMNGGAGNQHVLREFEERAKKIEKAKGKLAELDATLETLESSIKEIRDQWEPQLDELIGQISEAFADNFSKIQCAGEVGVHKDEDFDLWAIQIKVKFREHEQLSLLDSHRQSGGERAVSTIFYLMALQSLARAPFRVVDEINQGMDPRNERLVHSRMVDIACSENSASQYFLITPKLLNGLKYCEGMKVHCIASGEFMPEDHRELDFGILAQRALAVRAAG